jgi:hypothetical protein
MPQIRAGDGRVAHINLACALFAAGLIQRNLAFGSLAPGRHEVVLTRERPTGDPA